MSSESKFSRRDFLKVSALGAAGALLMPSGLAAAAKSKKNEKTAANDTISRYMWDIAIHIELRIHQ